MIKRVALVTALALACIPITSFALGLGPITMRSALNQPLLAEIDIHSAQPKISFFFIFLFSKYLCTIRLINYR